jgi:hypothetical protein
MKSNRAYALRAVPRDINSTLVMFIAAETSSIYSGIWTDLISSEPLEVRN